MRPRIRPRSSHGNNGNACRRSDPALQLALHRIGVAVRDRAHPHCDGEDDEQHKNNDENVESERERLMSPGNVVTENLRYPKQAWSPREVRTNS